MSQNNTTRGFSRYAQIGLYVAGLAAIVSIGLFIVFKTVNLPLQISMAMIVVGLAAFILIDPHQALSALTGRQARYGSNALLLSVAFFGIVIVVNYLINSQSKQWQWDLTEDKTNSLTSETVKTLESLKSPVTATAYYTSQMSPDTTRTLLQNFKNKSNGKFDFEFLDPYSHPINAQQDKVTRDGTVVLKMDNRQEQVTFPSEETLTTALVRLANPGKRAVYFLTGHGEYPLDSASDTNYSQAKAALEAKNYTVNTLNLLATPKIPDDALAIIVAGPTKPLSQQEIDLIKAYQQKGGSIVYLGEPRPATQFGDQPDPMEKYLLETWGIRLDEDVVIDPSSSQPLYAVSQRFGDHEITRQMYSQVLVLPVARSVRAENSKDVPKEITLTELAYSSDLAWGEADYQSIQQNQVKADASKDVIGPVALAVAGVNSTTKARVLVVGDSDFAGSKAYTQYGNSDFFLNGVDWTAVQENLISLTPRQPIQRLLVPPQQASMGLVLLGSVFLLPALVLVTGVTVWAQRRRRG